MLRRVQNKRPIFDCRRVGALLGAYLEHELPSAEADAIRAHLVGCPDCRQAAAYDADMAHRLQSEGKWQRHRLAPEAAARLQEQVYKRMRRTMMLQRATRLALGVATLVMLAFVALGGYGWWQQVHRGIETTPAANPTPAITAEPTLPVSTVGPTRTLPITVRFACQSSRLAEFESLASKFSAANPSIQIEILAIDDMAADDPTNLWLGLALESDTAYYLVSWDAVDQGLFRDLTPFIESDTTFEREDFFPGMFEAFQAQGRVWALPSQARLRFLYYDKELFDKAGVSYPTMEWTPEAFLAAAQQLTARQGLDAIQYGFVDTLGIGREAFVLTQAGDLTADQPPLDAPIVADAVRWYTDLALRYQVMPQSLMTQESNDRAADLIDSGRAAMWSETFSQIIASQSGETVGMVPFPTNGNPVVPAFMYGYVMSAGTPHPQESWRWLNFLSHQQLLGNRDLLADMLPARRSVAEQNGYWDRFDTQMTPLIRYASEHLILDPFDSEKRLQLNEAIDAVLAGRSVEDALAQAQTAFEQHIAQTAQATPAPVVVATPQPEGVVGTVTLSFVCNSSDRPIFVPIVNDFQALNPGIRIDLVDLEAVVDLSSKPSMVEVTRQLVSAADTAYWTVVPAAMQVGLLYNLSPFIETDSGFKPDDFFPHMLEAFQWEGGTWALPSQAVPTMIFYDKTAFDAAGLPYPKPGWTRDDFLAAAQQLTVHGDSEVERYGYVDPFGGVVYSFVLAPSTTIAGEIPPLDSQAVADALRWMTDLALRHQVAPNPWMPAPPPEGPWAVAQALVDNHRAAMWSDTLGNYEYRSRSFELGVVPFPQSGERSTPAWTYGYMISAGTSHPQEAWRWLAFLTHQRIMDPDGPWLDSVPARRSVAEQTHYWDRFGEETRTAVRYAAEHLFFPTGGAADTELALAVRRVFEGQPVEEALAQAQAAFEQHLAQTAQATPAPAIVTTPQPEGAASAVTITFAPPPGVEVLAYRALADAFNQAHTEVEVQIISPGQAQTTDCFAGEQSVADLNTRAKLLNLQSLLETDSAFSLDDFYPRFLDALRFQDDLYGIPSQAQMRVLFYNRDLFDAAGVAYPEPGWTLDDLLTYAVALTQGDGDEKQYGFLPLNGDASDLQAFVALQGASLWDDKGQPRFNASDVVAAVQWYADLAMKHGVMPAFPEDLPDQYSAGQDMRNALVRAGRVAMWTDFTGLDRSDVLPLDARIGMAPLPTGDQAVTDVLYEGLFIASDTRQPQACWEWLKFLSEKTETVRGLPARRSILESVAFAEQVGQDVVNSYRASLEYADLQRPTTPKAGAEAYWLYQALKDILLGESADAALARAQQQTEE